jgi:hypothetical protein
MKFYAGYGLIFYQLALVFKIIDVDHRDMAFIYYCSVSMNFSGKVLAIVVFCSQYLYIDGQKYF